MRLGFGSRTQRMQKVTPGWSAREWIECLLQRSKHSNCILNLLPGRTQVAWTSQSLWQLIPEERSGLFQLL
jgi:hypothetical protein